MKRSDKKVIGLLLGSIFPALSTVLFIIIWYIVDRGTDILGFFVTIGFLLGLLVDVFYLKKWTKRRYKHPFSLMILIFAIFNLIAFTIGLGIPLLNLVVGAIAGYYMANRLFYCKIEEEEQPRYIKKTIVLSVSSMAVMAIFSGVIAFINPSTGISIQPLLGLGNLDSKGLIIAIIILTAGVLVISQYFITRIVLTTTYRKLQERNY